MKGLKRSVKELDPSYVMDGVARGTGSLARHTVGGIADSASLLTETFSKNMAVLSLDRNYAQRRDRFKALPGASTTFTGGVESAVVKLISGVLEGVTGIVQKPIRGAEKDGVEGFAKGIGKGLLGLLVKPVIGLSDAATDVMIGVKGTVEAGHYMSGVLAHTQMRPRRVFYTYDKVFRSYNLADSTASALMIRTSLSGEIYLSHCDMGGRVAILSVKKFLLLSEDGKQELLIKFKQMKYAELRKVAHQGGVLHWGVFIFLKFVNKAGSEVEVVTSEDKELAVDLCLQIKGGINQAANNRETE